MTGAEERRPGPGHNQGPPLDPMRSWRRHCWRAARRRLLRPLPLEVVRRRVARAARLGLVYRRYEMLVLGGGEVEALLFAGDTLVVSAPYASPAGQLDPAVVGKLAAVTGCRRLVLAGPGGLDAIRAGAAAVLDGAIRVPSRRLLQAPPAKADREALAAGFRKRRLPAGCVALIGQGTHGPTWSAAARLAGFVPAAEYFAT